MASDGDVAALGRLEGVREATLCGTDGAVLQSSSPHPELDAAAMSLHGALQALQASMPVLGTPLTMTIDAEQGSLHVAQSESAILIVSTTADANLGAVRLAMREALGR